MASAASRNRPGIFALAREFGVPYQRLRGRIYETYPKALDDVQEQAVICMDSADWCNGYIAYPSIVVQAVRVL